MDTQIGTRPQIGALEIHQAYILASLNWLQQTRSLEMNHVAIEKAEKAKLLGFDHSSVITDAKKKAKRQKILDLMAKKQDAELESKSYEELAKELEALS